MFIGAGTFVLGLELLPWLVQRLWPEFDETAEEARLRSLSAQTTSQLWVGYWVPDGTCDPHCEYCPNPLMCSVPWFHHSPLCPLNERKRWLWIGDPSSASTATGTSTR
jgi:hypothetical protein